jgi:hypothetical protein
MVLPAGTGTPATLSSASASRPMVQAGGYSRMVPVITAVVRACRL